MGAQFGLDCAAAVSFQAGVQLSDELCCRDVGCVAGCCGDWACQLVAGCCPCEVCPAALLSVLVVLVAAMIVNMLGSEAASSDCFLAATGGQAHCGSCPFMVGSTLMWSAPAGCLQCSLLKELLVLGFWILFTVRLFEMSECGECAVSGNETDFIVRSLNLEISGTWTLGE